MANRKNPFSFEDFSKTFRDDCTPKAPQRTAAQVRLFVYGHRYEKSEGSQEEYRKIRETFQALMSSWKNRSIQISIQDRLAIRDYLLVSPALLIEEGVKENLFGHDTILDRFLNEQQDVQIRSLEALLDKRPMTESERISLCLLCSRLTGLITLPGETLQHHSYLELLVEWGNLNVTHWKDLEQNFPELLRIHNLQTSNRFSGSDPISFKDFLWNKTKKALLQFYFPTVEGNFEVFLKSEKNRHLLFFFLQEVHLALKNPNLKEGWESTKSLCTTLFGRWDRSFQHTLKTFLFSYFCRFLMDEDTWTSVCDLSLTEQEKLASHFPVQPVEGDLDISQKKQALQYLSMAYNRSPPFIFRLDCFIRPLSQEFLERASGYSDSILNFRISSLPIDLQCVTPLEPVLNTIPHGRGFYHYLRNSLVLPPTYLGTISAFDEKKTTISSYVSLNPGCEEGQVVIHHWISDGTIFYLESTYRHIKNRLHTLRIPFVIEGFDFYSDPLKRNFILTQLKAFLSAKEKALEALQSALRAAQKELNLIPVDFEKIPALFQTVKKQFEDLPKAFTIRPPERIEEKEKYAANGHIFYEKGVYSLLPISALPFLDQHFSFKAEKYQPIIDSLCLNPQYSLQVTLQINHDGEAVDLPISITITPSEGATIAKLVVVSGPFQSFYYYASMPNFMSLEEKKFFLFSQLLLLKSRIYYFKFFKQPEAKCLVYPPPKHRQLFP